MSTEVKEGRESNEPQLAPFERFGISLDFRLERGTVLQVDAQTRTHVYSVGGAAGYNGQSSTPPSVHSKTDESQRIWYARADGSHSWIAATNQNLRFLGGHRLIFLSLYHAKEGWKPCWVFNRETRESWTLADVGAYGAYMKPGFWTQVGGVLLTTLLIYALVSAAERPAAAMGLQDDFPWITLLLLAYPLYGIVRIFQKIARAGRAISDHITTLTTQITKLP